LLTSIIFLQQLTNSQTFLPELPVPLVDNTTIKILLAGHQQPQMGLIDYSFYF
jgi:hypothetical protein